MSWSHSVYLEYTSIIPLMFSIISRTRFNYNFQSAYILCILTVLPVKTLLTCVHCGLCLHFHERAPVVCAVFLLARYDWGLCDCFVVSRLLYKSCQAIGTGQASWKRYYRAGKTISSQDKIFLLPCISELMHSSPNALWAIYRLSVACGKEACVFHFSQGLVSWIYTSCYFESFDKACWLIPVCMYGYDQLFPIEIICLWIWVMFWLQNHMLFPKLMPRGSYISNYTSSQHKCHQNFFFSLIVKK